MLSWYAAIASFDDQNVAQMEQGSLDLDSAIDLSKVRGPAGEHLPAVQCFDVLGLCSDPDIVQDPIMHAAVEQTKKEIKKANL